LFELFGIAKREAPAISYEVYTNRKMNRYLVNQMLRLEKCRRNPALYWVIAKQLMKSTAFTVSSIQHVLKGWHRKRPYYEVLKIANEVNKMAVQGATAVEYYRTFIPKPGKATMRPLGVPTLPWRVYLHM